MRSHSEITIPNSWYIAIAIGNIRFEVFTAEQPRRHHSSQSVIVHYNIITLGVRRDSHLQQRNICENIPIQCYCSMKKLQPYETETGLSETGLSHILWDHFFVCAKGWKAFQVIARVVSAKRILCCVAIAARKHPQLSKPVRTLTSTNERERERDDLKVWQNSVDFVFTLTNTPFFFLCPR
jgi:hypothetical protein